MCKAFSLDDFFASLHRALPYANMSCPFRALVALPYASMSYPFRAFVALPYASRCRGFVLIVCAVQMMVE